jgi:hypothetical protein
MYLDLHVFGDRHDDNRVGLAVMTMKKKICLDPAVIEQ